MNEQHSRALERLSGGACQQDLPKKWMVRLWPERTVGDDHGTLYQGKNETLVTDLREADRFTEAEAQSAVMGFISRGFNEAEKFIALTPYQIDILERIKNEKINSIPRVTGSL